MADRVRILQLIKSSIDYSDSSIKSSINLWVLFYRAAEIVLSFSLLAAKYIYILEANFKKNGLSV